MALFMKLINKQLKISILSLKIMALLYFQNKLQRVYYADGVASADNKLVFFSIIDEYVSQYKNTNGIMSSNLQQVELNEFVFRQTGKVLYTPQETTTSLTGIIPSDNTVEVKINGSSVSNITY